MLGTHGSCCRCSGIGGRTRQSRCCGHPTPWPEWRWLHCERIDPGSHCSSRPAAPCRSLQRTHDAHEPRLPQSSFRMSPAPPGPYFHPSIPGRHDHYRPLAAIRQPSKARTANAQHPATHRPEGSPGALPVATAAGARNDAPFSRRLQAIAGRAGAAFGLLQAPVRQRSMSSGRKVRTPPAQAQ
jgi:hypothetical protein